MSGHESDDDSDASILSCDWEDMDDMDEPLNVTATDMAVDDYTMNVGQQGMGDHEQVPPPGSVKLEVENRQFLATWRKPANYDHPCYYKVELLLATNSKSDKPKTLKNEGKTMDTRYVFPAPNTKEDMIKSHVVSVSTVKLGSSDLQSVPVMSTRQMMCQSLGNNVFMDYFRQLRKTKSVYEGYMKGAENPKKVAIKIISTDVYREISNAEKLNQMDNIVTVRCTNEFKDIGGKKAYIAMELCQEDALHEIIMKGYLKDKPDEAKKVLLHIMRGLSYLHENNVLHRDLKPRNILRSMDGRNMKVCDLGHSKQTEEGQSIASKSVPDVGTTGWGSPEHYSGTNHIMSKKSDIFSAGLIFCFVLSQGKHAFGDRDDKWKTKIIDREPIQLPELICDDPSLAADLILSMLEFEPDNRPSSKDVLAHPFFWSIKKRLDFIEPVNDYIQGTMFRFRPGQILHPIEHEIRSELDQMADGYKDWYQKIANSSIAGSAYISRLARGEIYPYKPYNPACMRDLIRLIRNTDKHQSQNADSRALFRNDRANVWIYFSKLFPKLLPGLFHIFYKLMPGMESVQQLTNIRFPGRGTIVFTARKIWRSYAIVLTWKQMYLFVY